MKTSEEGKRRLVKFFEGLRLNAYPDPASGGIPWTIGYGHTKGVRSGDKCTEEQADAYLEDDLKDAENAVSRLVTAPLGQYQFDAVVDFVFNVGIGNFTSSTLLKRLNAWDYGAAADQFLMWTFAAGKSMDGLKRRREAEREVFMGE